MCVLAFAWRVHPRWPIVLAGNRDELHERPASALARWDEPDDLVAGRDLQSGGTWLGVSERGNLAVVTNLRGYGAPRPGCPSRGTLVVDALSGKRLHGDGELSKFNPFNLIVADREQASFLSNRPTIVRRQLAPGIYGLSNGALDQPWPKTIRLKAMLREWILSPAKHPEALLDGLGDDTLPAPGIRSALSSDVPQEPALSPIFIRNAVYGTRCSTVVAIDRHWEGMIVERRFDAMGGGAGETAISFSWRA